VSYPSATPLDKRGAIIAALWRRWAARWTDFWWYWLGLAGGAVAGLVYDYVFQTPEGPEEAHAA